jgi:PLP dependent protein
LISDGFEGVDTDSFPAKLAVVQDRIGRAAQKTGRSLADVTILAVTKNVPIPAIQDAWRAGIRHMAESRIQEATAKRAELAVSSPNGEGITWHMIGHLQSNKVKKAVELFECIQSLDSLPLAEVIDREAGKRGKTMPCLLEVKTSDEPAKFGVPPDGTEALLDGVERLKNVRVEGLMTIAPYFDDAEKARPYFRRLRELFERLKKRFRGSTPILSMGMSHDFDVAVEEGSTMVRLGTILFGERPRPPQ